PLFPYTTLFRSIIFHCLRNILLQFRYTSGIARVSTQKFRRCASIICFRTSHSFPKCNCCVRIISCHCHDDQTRPICCKFILTREGQHTYRSSDTIGLVENRYPLTIRHLACRSQHLSTHLQGHLIGNLCHRMFLNSMGNFVSHDRSQPRIRTCQRQYPCINCHLTTWHTPSIHCTTWH